MRLHRFFVKEKIPKAGEFVVTNETLLNQWRNVLRMEEGDKAILFDGDGYESLCEVVSLTGKIAKKNALLKVLETKRGLVPARDVTFYFSILNKNNFYFFL